MFLLFVIIYLILLFTYINCGFICFIFLFIILISCYFNFICHFSCYFNFNLFHCKFKIDWKSH